MCCRTTRWRPVAVSSRAYEAKTGGPIKGEMRHKSHLLFPWINDLMRHPRVLDAVEDVLGPNLLVWSTSFFIKEARDPGFVSWHQDATYWGLSSPDVCTAWIALSPANKVSGCMKFIPGTHKEQVEHADTFHKDNLLTRGQEIAVEVDESKAIYAELKPGQASLHHVLLFHGSAPNQSDDRRIGLAIRYVPTHVRQAVGANDSATLVRGVDAHKNFATRAAAEGRSRSRRRRFPQGGNRGASGGALSRHRQDGVSGLMRFRAAAVDVGRGEGVQ